MKSYLRKFSGKSAAVLGIGVSNTPLVELLVRSGARVTVRDSKAESLHEPEKIKKLKDLNVSLKLGADYLKGICEDYIFRSPGIRFDAPEISKAVSRGSVLTSEAELFFDCCKSKIIAVTGSDGKSTTTTLIYEILKKAGVNCFLGGNIGTPLVSFLENTGENDVVVAELSSFQLHTMKRSPHIAVVTNVTPNHLDYHKGFEEYIEAKTNIFAHQGREGILVVNSEDEVCRRYAGQAPGNVRFFSSKSEQRNGTFVRDGEIFYAKDEVSTKIMDKSDILLRGEHNVQNYLAAISAVFDFVSPEDVKAVAKNFAGVDHRLQLVREVNGVKFYNSSIDSSPSRTIAALSTFEEKIILIAGGKDKGIPYDALGQPIVDHVKVLVLTGHTASKISESVKNTGCGDSVKIIFEEDFNNTVNIAFANAQKGDCVLLSPASTSFDRFKNFVERGNTFCSLVNKL